MLLVARVLTLGLALVQSKLRSLVLSPWAHPSLLSELGNNIHLFLPILIILLPLLNLCFRLLVQFVLRFLCLCELIVLCVVADNGHRVLRFLRLLLASNQVNNAQCFQNIFLWLVLRLRRPEFVLVRCCIGLMGLIGGRVPVWLDLRCSWVASELDLAEDVRACAHNGVGVR